MRPAGIDPLVVTAKVDHAARMGRIELRRTRNGLVLGCFTLACVHHHAEVILLAQLALIAQSGLGLLDGFAGVVLVGTRSLVRILFPLLLRQAARIVRFDINAVKDQAQLANVVDAHAKFGIGQVLTRTAVVAIAAGNKAGRGDGVVHVTCLSTVSGCTGGFQAVAPATVAAVVAAGFDSRGLLTGFGSDVNHAAGGVTIQGREGAAQHFDALDAVEIDIGGLSLAVRHGRRDAIDVHADAAHAVGRAGAKATHRELQILRIVLAILDL